MAVTSDIQESSRTKNRSVFESAGQLNRNSKSRDKSREQWQRNQSDEKR
jgi:hypothetical protein